jgi:hypothetical protein
MMDRIHGYLTLYLYIAINVLLGGAFLDVFDVSQAASFKRGYITTTRNHPCKLSFSYIFSEQPYCITLCLFNIAMENGPFIDGLPIKNGDVPWLC